jgi:hypothetical protein
MCLVQNEEEASGSRKGICHQDAEPSHSKKLAELSGSPPRDPSRCSTHVKQVRSSTSPLPPPPLITGGYPISHCLPAGGCPFSRHLLAMLPLFLRQGAPPHSLCLQFQWWHRFSHRLPTDGCNHIVLLPPYAAIMWPYSLPVLQSHHPVPLSCRSRSS